MRLAIKVLSSNSNYPGQYNEQAANEHSVCKLHHFSLKWEATGEKGQRTHTNDTHLQLLITIPLAPILPARVLAGLIYFKINFDIFLAHDE